jgi:hypothetical protein
MKIDINLSSPFYGETNCRRTRGDNGERQRAALLSFGWRDPTQTRYGGKPRKPALAGHHADLVHLLFQHFFHTSPALLMSRIYWSKLGCSWVRSKCQERASSFLTMSNTLGSNRGRGFTPADDLLLARAWVRASAEGTDQDATDFWDNVTEAI